MCLHSSVPSNSKVLMLLSQLERINGDPLEKNVEMARQVTAKILHLIQTQGESKFFVAIGVIFKELWQL